MPEALRAGYHTAIPIVIASTIQVAKDMTQKRPKAEVVAWLDITSADNKFKQMNNAGIMLNVSNNNPSPMKK